MNKHTLAFPLTAVLAVAALTLGACTKTPEPAVVVSPVESAATAASAAATATASMSSATPVNVSDGDVTEHVKTAIAQNEALKGTDITVLTTKGDVKLTGMVNSQTQVDAAVAIASAADGGHTVHNELTIKK